MIIAIGSEYLDSKFAIHSSPSIIIIAVAICDPARENWSYVHKIHLFVLWYISPLLFKILNCITFLMKFCINCGNFIK